MYSKVVFKPSALATEVTPLVAVEKTTFVSPLSGALMLRPEPG
jgi:hypothetical protein